MHSQRDYFDAILGSGFDEESGLGIVVCALLDGNLTTAFCTSIEEAQRKIEIYSKSHDVFVSLGLTERPRTPGSRGTEVEVKLFLGLVIDIDCANVKRKKSGHFETLPEAVAALEHLAFKPSMVVSTGYGIHAYWLWKEPWDVSDPEERALAKGISQGWQRTAAKTLDKTIDATHSIEHIYRVPGTVNRKYEEHPECEILELNDRRYDPSEFEGFCAQQEPALPGVRLGVLTEAIPPRVQATITNSSDFRSTWEHKDRDQADSSQSGWDWRIACDLVAAGFDDQDVAEALLANRRMFDGKSKPKRYYERTIARVRASRQAEPEGLKADEQSWYERLSRLVGVRVKAIEMDDPKGSIEDRTYRVLFASGDRIIVRKESQIQSIKYWQRSLRGVSPYDQMPIPQAGKWEWEQLMEKLKLHVVVLEQKSAAQDIINDIATYLYQTSVDVDNYNLMRKNDQRPLHYDNQYLFIHKDFLVWYAKLYGRIDKAAMRLALEELSATRRRLGPQAIEYWVIQDGDLRAEAIREGATNHPDGTPGAGGGTPQDPQGHGDLDSETQDRDGIRGLPGFNHPN